MRSEAMGGSTIAAEIGPPGTVGSHRGPGAADDECEQPAAPGGVPPAGNCVSQALAVTWGEEAPECADGVDNDDDDYVDLEDPGCEDGDDDSETPEPSAERHRRRTNLRFRDWVGPGDEGLVIFGRVRLVDENDRFRACTQGQPVLIQRFVDGDWETSKDVFTNARGRYAGVVFDRPGRYRAVAFRATVPAGDDFLHVCGKAVKAKTHHHRR